MLTGEFEPFYFGGDKKPLFGCYHAPRPGSARSCGVVLCYPMGQEYLRCHRCYRQVALRLSNVGFGVLRFDFYGCGDSGGSREEGQWQQWMTDIGSAIEELRRRSGSVKVSLIGVRLGGTLALMTGAARHDIEDLVLWDPVVSGRKYLAELRRLHWAMFPYPDGDSGRVKADEKQSEVMGFPLTDSLRMELEKIDALAIRRRPAERIMLIESRGRVFKGALKTHLERIGSQVEYRRLPGPKIWLQEAENASVPNETLAALVSWVSSGHA